MLPLSNNEHLVGPHGDRWPLSAKQLTFFDWARREYSFHGLDVLAVGGGQPKSFVINDLEVNSWLSVEDPDYLNGGPREQTIYSSVANFDEFEKRDGLRVQGYEIVTDRVANLGSALHGHFDLIISIDAFQRIKCFGPALGAMFKALKPGGALRASFGPIWSAPNGHMLRTTTDGIGRIIDCDSDLIDQWGHLRWSEPEFYLRLKKRTDAATAAAIAHEVFHSSRANRLFVEDYLEFIRYSSFADGVRQISATQVKIGADVAQILAGRYPQYADHMAVSELSIHLDKPPKYRTMRTPVTQVSQPEIRLARSRKGHSGCCSETHSAEDGGNKSGRGKYASTPKY